MQTELTPIPDVANPSARDAWIRELLGRVDVIARSEFLREDKIPKGERTAFWDPLARICLILGISRTKLSSYSRELTGLRAHELTDRIKAESLPEALFEQVKAAFESLKSAFTQQVDRARMLEPQYCAQFKVHVARQIRALRSGDAAAAFAMKLGYANPSRLKKACLITQKKSLNDLEASLLNPLVQKFFDELIQDERDNTEFPEQMARQEKAARDRSNSVKSTIKEEPSAEARACGEKIIAEAVAATLRQTRVA